MFDRLTAHELGPKCPACGRTGYSNKRVTVRNGNHSTFNGYRFTPSNYSEIRCKDCRHYWRTKAQYVSQLLDASESDFIMSQTDA